MSEVLQCIINDFKEPLIFLPVAVVFGIIYMLICRYVTVKRSEDNRGSTYNSDKKDNLHEKCNKENTGIKENSYNIHFITALFVMYVVMVLYVTLFSREMGSRDDFSFGLFETWGETAQSQAYVIENFILFVPFGILFPVIFKRAGSCINTVCISAILSILIETIQGIFKIGYVQLDDFVMNVAGALFGYIILFVVEFIRRDI